MQHAWDTLQHSAQAWGFIGSIVVVILFMIFIWRAIDMLHLTTDATAKLLGIGLISVFFFHILANVGMTIGLMPITGLPLPFLSYGGSFTLTVATLVGLILNARVSGQDF